MLTHTTVTASNAKLNFNAFFIYCFYVSTTASSLPFSVFSDPFSSSEADGTFCPLTIHAAGFRRFSPVFAKQKQKPRGARTNGVENSLHGPRDFSTSFDFSFVSGRELQPSVRFLNVWRHRCSHLKFAFECHVIFFQRILFVPRKNRMLSRCYLEIPLYYDSPSSKIWKVP